MFKEHLANMIRAFMAISPSRNYITQFLYLIKESGGIEYATLESGYKELLNDEVRENIAKAFGIAFDEKVYLEDGYGRKLTEFIDKIFELFEDEEFRKNLEVLLKDEFPEGIPNLRKEWIEVKLQGLRNDQNYGETAVAILKELTKFTRMKADELEKKLNKSKSKILSSLELLKIYGLVSVEYDGSYRIPSDIVNKYKDILEAL